MLGCQVTHRTRVRHASNTCGMRASRPGQTVESDARLAGYPALIVEVMVNLWQRLMFASIGGRRVHVSEGDENLRELQAQVRPRPDGVFSGGL